VTPGPRRTRVTTADGAVVTTRFVVVATGYEVPEVVPQRGHAVASTWAMATRAQPRALRPDRSLVWEAPPPYLYVRTTDDGRVICGGEDEGFSSAAARDALLVTKTRTLERRLQRLLPSLDAEAEFAWCGSFGSSTTGTPSIGAVPGMARCFAVLGFGGNGITFSALAAQMIRAELLRLPDPDRDLFAF